MTQTSLVRIPAGHGKATRAVEGQQVRLVNSSGRQVVDVWALNAYDVREYMCMPSSRVWNMHLNPRVGDVMVTNRRRPILRLVEDTSPGVHDTLMAACDRYRYDLLGCKGYHRNCQDNMFEGLLELGVNPAFPLPGSFNAFMSIPLGADGSSLDVRPTACEPGAHILFRAEMDCYLAFSACPQDILPIHGEGGAPPTDAHFEVIG